jgi:hypothetical protein
MKTTQYILNGRKIAPGCEKFLGYELFGLPKFFYNIIHEP